MRIWRRLEGGWAGERGEKGVGGLGEEVGVSGLGEDKGEKGVEFGGKELWGLGLG